jgi:hypothetical protein
MKLLITQFSPTSCLFIPLWSKYSPRRPVLKHTTTIINKLGNARMVTSNVCRSIVHPLLDSCMRLTRIVRQENKYIIGDSWIMDCWKTRLSSVLFRSDWWWLCHYCHVSSDMRTKRLHASYAEQRQIQDQCDQNELKIPNNVDSLRCNNDSHWQLSEVRLLHTKPYLPSSSELCS